MIPYKLLEMFMKVQLLGAAQTVTGSCYVIEANKVRFAIDCGMHQGNAEIEKRNLHTAAYKASELDFILLTHAHIDHSGLLPRMAKENFTGPVYCTDPTRDLIGIMLLDSAHIQEMEAEWANRKRARRGGHPIDPLYTREDAEKVTGQIKGLSYNAPFEPAPGVRVTYRDAGHILGSSFLELEITEAEGVTRLIFSGDLGRPNALLVDDAATPKMHADYLFLESTYGDRNHKDESSSRDELAKAIEYSYSRGEKTIIPAFAVERTQELIYSLFLLHKEGKLPKGIPIYVDSPLAIKATQIFRKYPTYFDRETIALMEKGEDPLTLPNLKYTPEVKESQAINAHKGPGIVISASGMCNAGRIKHHLRHNLWRPGASIVFCGYQAVGTPGRKIVDGAKSINILGDEVVISAKIFTIGGFSGHAGQSQILDWVSHFTHPELRVFLMHGEGEAQNTLAKLLHERFKVTVNIPEYMEELILAPGKELLVQVNAQLLPKKVNWDMLLADTQAKMEQLRAGMAGAANRPWAEQVELQEQVLDLNRRLLQIASQM